MKRKEWTFNYTGARLAKAAEVKASHHADRLKWWEAKKAEVMAAVRDRGIEVHDSVAANYTNKGVHGAEIVVDASMQRDLDECHMKIREHAALLRDFNGWVQVFLANPEASLSLDHDDWLHFFGGQQ